MAGSNYVLDKGFTAGGAIGKYRCVEVSATAAALVTVANAQGEQVIGVCQEEVTAADATNGRVVDVRLMGITRAVNGLATAINPGQVLTTSANGGVEAAAAADLVLGIAVSAAPNVVGAHLDVLITQAGVF
jgi:hypothetical protein